MPPANSFDDYSPWIDSTKTISRVDRITCLLNVILHGNNTEKYNKHHIETKKFTLQTYCLYFITTISFFDTKQTCALSVCIVYRQY